MKKAFILAILGYLAFWFYENKWAYSDMNLKKQVEEFNKNMPIKSPDGDFTFTSVETEPGKILIYNIELMHSADLLPENAAEDFKSPSRRKNFVPSMCTASGLESFLRHGITLVYSVRTKDKVHLGDIKVTAADCAWS